MCPIQRLNTKKAGESFAGFLKVVNLRSSNRPDILCSRTFRSLSSGVGDHLAFRQFLEGYSIKGRQVEEDVVTVSCVDESEALVRQPFDGAFCHLICFLKKNIVESNVLMVEQACPSDPSTRPESN